MAFPLAPAPPMKKCPSCDDPDTKVVPLTLVAWPIRCRKAGITNTNDNFNRDVSIFFIYLTTTTQHIEKEISRQKETLQIDIFAGLKRKDWLFSAWQPGSEAVDCSSSSLYLKAMGYMQRSVPCAALTHTHTHTYSNNLIFVLLPRWLF